MSESDGDQTPLTYKLHPDARIMRVEEIPTELGHEFADGEQGFVLSVAGSRSNAQMIDAVAAQFLELFRTPCSVASAIVELAQAVGTDATDLVDDIYPAVRSWHRAGVLVDPELDFGEADMPVLAPGTIIAGVTVGDCLRSLTDTQVYRGTLPGRGPVVLKYVPTGGKDSVLECLRHEALMLERLHAGSVPHIPAFIDADVTAPEPWLIVGDAGATTLEAMMHKQSLAWPERTALMLRLLDVFAEFHEAGFLHGDVNPANVVVGDDGEFTLVDFGGTVPVDDPSTANRIGVPVYFEPEFAAAFLENETPPASSVAGEIHALANICYRIITGHSPVRLGLQHQVSIMQIANIDARPFAQVGITWPAAEVVLLQALDRRPAARFASVRAFAEAMTEACRTHPTEHADVGPSVDVDLGDEADDGLRSLILEQLRRRVVDPRAVARQDPECRSRSEIYSGQAGLGLAALVYAEAELDSDALAAAELWLDAGESVPSYAEIERDDGESPSVMSLLQGPLGLTWARTAVALSSGDWRRAEPSMAEFGDALAQLLSEGGLSSEPEHTRLDAANGPLSTLLGAACLAYRSRPFRTVLDVDALLRCGDQIYDEAIALLSNRPLAEGIGPYRYLGMAHGSMGALYSLLRWRIERANGDRRLDQLVLDFTEGCQTLGGEPAVPPVTATPRQPVGGGHRLLPGWCHGAAGHTLFWGTAFEALGDQRLADHVVAAAQYVVDHPASQHGSLCCGLAGQAVALRRAPRSPATHGGPNTPSNSRAEQRCPRATSATQDSSREPPEPCWRCCRQTVDPHSSDREDHRWRL